MFWFTLCSITVLIQCHCLHLIFIPCCVPQRDWLSVWFSCCWKLYFIPENLAGTCMNTLLISQTLHKWRSSECDSLMPSLFIAVISWGGCDSVAIKCAVAVMYRLITLAIDTWLERCDIWRGGATVNCLPAWGLNSTMTWRSLTVFDIWLVFPDSRSEGSLFWPYVKRGKQHVSVLSSILMKELNWEQNRS